MHSKFFRNIIIFLFLFICSFTHVNAQRLKWHHVLKGVKVHDFKSDAAGNIYLIGHSLISDSVTLGNKFLWNKGGRLLIKFSPDGNFEWFKPLKSGGIREFFQIDTKQNIITCYHNSINKSKLIVEKFNPLGDQISTTTFNIKNPRTGSGGSSPASYELFLQDFAIYENNLYFLVYAGTNTSIEGVNLNTNNKHYLVKADFSGKIEWTVNVGLTSSSENEKGYFAVESDGNLLVTISSMVSTSNKTWFKPTSHLYRLSSNGIILQDRQFPEFKRYTAFRYIGISPGGKISVAASVDSQAVINGKVHDGHNLVLMHLNKDLSINKYITAKGLVIYVTFAIDADDNFYTFGASTTYGNTFYPYLNPQRGTTLGDTTINKDGSYLIPRSFLTMLDGFGNPAFIRRLGRYKLNNWDDLYPIRPGWALVSNCNQVYIGADFKDTIQLDNTTFIPKQSGPGTYGENFLIASIENNADSIKTQLQPLCKKALACKTIANKGFNKFNWDFGDGQSSSAESPVHTYNSPGNYVVTLTCSTPLGCEKIITDTVFVPDVIKATFNAESNSGCQWVGFHFKDSSFADTINTVSGQSWRWDFGDGSTNTARNPIHIYTKSGNYTVRLIYSNGFCSDTFTSIQNINILEAPKPGFTASVTKGCTPLKVELKDKSDGTAVKYFYNFGNGQTDTIASPTVVYNKPGIYKLKQELLGQTGCITSDSALITVIQGISPQDAPRLEYASVTGKNKTEIEWQPLFAAEKYFIYRSYENNASSTYKLISETDDTTFTDTLINPSEASFIYKIIAKDSCGNLSNESNIGKTILLKAKNENNQFAILQWTPYEDWKAGGVATYILESTDSADHYTEIANLSGNNTSFTDNNFWNNEKQQRCYRIKAISAANTQIQSFSNIICLPYIPQLWIPTAFSPNDDKLNDTFRIVCTGIAELEMQIFNRWGERVCTIDNTNSSWDGKYNGEKVPPGEYLYVLKAKGTDQQKIYTSGSLQVVR